MVVDNMKEEVFSVDAIELFGNLILIKNPVKNELDKNKFDKMPKALQAETLIKAESLFYNCKVIKTGDSCTKIQEGDCVFITNKIAADGIFVDDINYILLRETSILGKNVGTKENI